MDYYQSIWPVSEDYRVTVTPQNGKPQDLITFAAHQHQPDTFNYESELETFARWDFDGSAHVCIEVLNPNIKVQNVCVRPRKAEIYPAVNPAQRTVEFDIDTANLKHRILSVEIDGIKRPCFLFTEPVQNDIPNLNGCSVYRVPASQNDNDVITQETFRAFYEAHDTIYFASGVYNMEYLAALGDNKTWYFEEGAVIRLRRPGEMKAHDHSKIRNGITITGKNVRLLGRGILDGKADTDTLPKPLTCNGNVLCVQDAENVTVEGLIFTHSMGFCLVSLRSSEVLFDLIRMAGSQDLTSNDGILVDGSKNVTVRRCFANNHDDSLEVKTHHYTKTSTENVLFEDCVVWNRGGMCLAAAWENWWDIKNVTWRRISVIHHENYGNGALCVYTGNRGLIDNLLFEDIDVEETPFGGIAITVEQHPWSYWGRSDVAEILGETLSDKPNDNWSYIGNLHFKNIEIGHTQGFDSEFYPKPKPPGNGNGHGGRGYKLHVPVPEFSSNQTSVDRSHLVGTITFENVYIHTYRDAQTFSRFGRGEDHYAGRPIPGHYLTDLTTDNWILWEGVNPQLWELIPGMTPEMVYTPKPDMAEHKARLEFWEKHVRFLAPPQK